MKKISIFLFLVILVLAGWCQAADQTITTVVGLMASVNQTGTHTIDPAGGADGVYVLTGGLNIAAADWNLTVLPGSTGNVTIDGSDSYYIIFGESGYGTNATGSMSGLSDTQRLILTQLGGGAGQDGVWCQGETSDSVYTFNYCSFTEASHAGGLNVRQGGTANAITVTCNNCIASNNAGDGFVIRTNATGELMTLVLNNCTATGNDPDASGGGDGDGATMHSTGQTLIIHGGSYTNNGKSGVCTAGGDFLVVDGAAFSGNGVTVHTVGDIGITTAVVPNVIIKDCVFTGLNTGLVPAHIHYGINGDTQSFILEGNVFKSPSATLANNTAVVRVGYDPEYLIIKDNIWIGFNSGSNVIYCVAGDSGAVAADAGTYWQIENNTIYDCEYGFNIGGDRWYAKNNIFSEIDVDAIEGATNAEYAGGTESGYNFWHNIGTMTFTALSTDWTSDPMLYNPGQSDVSLRPGSPALNAIDNRALGKGWKSIGAVQAKQVFDTPHSIYSPDKSSIFGD